MARTYRRDPYELEKGKTFRTGTKRWYPPPGWWVNQFMNRPKRCKNARGHAA